MSSKDEQMMCFESISGSSMSKEMNLQGRLLYTCHCLVYLPFIFNLPKSCLQLPQATILSQSDCYTIKAPFWLGEIYTFLVPSCAYIISLVLYFLKVKWCFLNTNKWVTMSNLPIWMGYVIIAMIFISKKKSEKLFLIAHFVFPQNEQKSILTSIIIKVIPPNDHIPCLT